MNDLFAVLLGYLLGCSSMAFYIGLLKKKDLRTAGSGNLGASNATVLFGWGAGVTVAIHDIGKAFLAVLLARWLFPEAEYAGVAAGTASVLGHVFPFYLKFRGGKGTASFFGMILALNWKLALVAAVLMILATLITDYIAVGTLCMILLAPVWMGLTTGKPLLAAILCLASLTIFFRHWENIGRIARGEEIGLRSTAKGEHRVKP